MLTPDLQRILQQRPLGLVFDIDGTISPIAPTPEEARLYPGMAELLQRARDCQGVKVGIITGRTVQSGAAMVNVEGLTYIGTHGLEWSDGLPSSSQIQLVPEALRYAEPGKQLLDLVEQKLTDIPGLRIERKQVGGAIHFRLSPDPQEALQRVSQLLTEPARQLNMRLEEGKMMVEVRAPREVAIDKGKALRRFVQRKDLQGVIFAGDDLTDLDAIKEVASLRKEGIAACSIAVKHADTPSNVLKQADITVEEVAGLAALLREILAAL
ncbi:trehalose-phosphatase [Ktedonosporobacter rubrisoli]|uniref:Trehalose 6-phosphate phosphatase n=1 Tax=Ktedonosporobacter rubrisoli TaxID=2509675 RepID=A0A4P6K5E5_KTERU|nr:trehalose-phosphatase [Ktedonosporobacter rubrisoli]QBD83212.1 trehalose-phosphatase [Ktedonosporobacter rubrisoli]